MSSSPAAFIFLIFLRKKSSSSWVNGSSLMSNCLPIILVIASCVTFGGFLCRFSKCCFHSFILSCWFAAFNFALVVLFLLLTSFIVCQAILDCPSSTESLMFVYWVIKASNAVTSLAWTSSVTLYTHRKWACSIVLQNVRIELARKMIFLSKYTTVTETKNPCSSSEIWIN